MKKKLYIAVRTTQNDVFQADRCFETLNAQEDRKGAIDVAKAVWQDHQFEIIETEITPNEDKYL